QPGLEEEGNATYKLERPEQQQEGQNECTLGRKKNVKPPSDRPSSSKKKGRRKVQRARTAEHRERRENKEFTISVFNLHAEVGDKWTHSKSCCTGAWKERDKSFKNFSDLCSKAR
ncbi:hypothetical protein L915_06164, partial [Phytophthora nicotianae]